MTMLLEQLAVIAGSLAILVPAGAAAYGTGRAQAIGTAIFAAEFIGLVAALVVEVVA